MTQTLISSEKQEISIGFERPFCIIGERINPTGRKLLAAEMAEGDYSRVVSDAIAIRINRLVFIERERIFGILDTIVIIVSVEQVGYAVAVCVYYRDSCRRVLQQSRSFCCCGELSRISGSGR